MKIFNYEVMDIILPERNDSEDNFKLLKGLVEKGSKNTNGL